MSGVVEYLVATYPFFQSCRANLMTRVKQCLRPTKKLDSFERVSEQEDPLDVNRITNESIWRVRPEHREFMLAARYA